MNVLKNEQVILMGWNYRWFLGDFTIKGEKMVVAFHDFAVS